MVYEEKAEKEMGGSEAKVGRCRAGNGIWVSKPLGFSSLQRVLSELP